MRASIIHLMYIICSEIERDTREPFPIQPKPSFSFHAAARSLVRWMLLLLTLHITKNININNILHAPSCCAHNATERERGGKGESVWWHAALACADVLESCVRRPTTLFHQSVLWHTLARLLVRCMPMNTLWARRPTRKLCFSCLVFIYRSIITVNCVNSAYCTPSASLSSLVVFVFSFLFFSFCYLCEVFAVGRSVAWSAACMYNVGVDYTLHFVCVLYALTFSHSLSRASRFSDWKNFTNKKRYFMGKWRKREKRQTGNGLLGAPTTTTTKHRKKI